MSGADPALAVPAEPASSLVPTGSDPGYEAMVYSAHLPNRTIAFVYKDGGPPLAGGIYRITRVRNTTKADKAAFHSPPADTCPLCNRPEDYP